MKRIGTFCDTELCEEIAVGTCVACDTDICARHGWASGLQLTVSRAVPETSSRAMIDSTGSGVGHVPLCYICLGKLAGHPALFRETIIPTMVGVAREAVKAALAADALR